MKNQPSYLQPGLVSAFRPLRRAVLLAALVATGTLSSAPSAIAPLPHEPRKVTIGGEEFFAVGFELLSAFDYTIVDAGTGATPEQIEQARQSDPVPAWLHAYQDKRVALTGYMMPLQLQNGLAKTFIIMRDVMTCCYGATPNMNDYVVVTMKHEGVKAIQDIPVELVGQLHIAQKYENGYVVSLYELDCEKFLGPKK